MKLGHKLRQQRRALGLDPSAQLTVAELEAHDAWLLEIKLLLSNLRVSKAERAIRDAEYERKRKHPDRADRGRG